MSKPKKQAKKPMKQAMPMAMPAKKMPMRPMMPDMLAAPPPMNFRKKR